MKKINDALDLFMNQTMHGSQDVSIFGLKVVEFVSIESGERKTTLLNCIYGFLKA